MHFSKTFCKLEIEDNTFCCDIINISNVIIIINVLLEYKTQSNVHKTKNNK